MNSLTEMQANAREFGRANVNNPTRRQACENDVGEYVHRHHNPLDGVKK